MNSFWKTVLAVITGIVLLGAVFYFLFFVVIIGGISSAVSKASTAVPKEFVLKMDMSRIALAEQSQDIPQLAMINTSSTEQPSVIGLWDAVQAINRAAADNAVKFIYLKADGLNGGMAHIEELRTALQNFRDSGKAVIAYTENPGNGSYYLASVADKVYMTSHGGGMNTLIGLATQVTYLKDILDRIGVNVQLIRHGKYKSAGEMFIRNDISAENREQYEALLGSIWNHWCAQIATSRNISADGLNKAIDELELNFPEDFLKAGLVDGLVTKDQLEEKLCTCFNVTDIKDVKHVSIEDYIANNKAVNVKVKNEIAIIYADGEIVDGKDIQQVAGDRFASVIRKVRDNKNVKAVVFRVNSPGGSVIASDKIRNEIELLRAEKPVVASYGNYAASGGYWISSSCDRIFADNSTLTGSIGVFSMIPDFGKVIKDKAHVNIVTIGTNKHSDMYSLTRALSPAELEYMQASVEDIYEQFTGLVAEGRDLEVSYVDGIAQGRVWSGSDAIDIKLVDEIGTLEDALKYAATLADGESSELSDWQIGAYPAPQTWLNMILESLTGPAEETIFSGTPFEGIEKAFSGFTQADAGKVYARIPYALEIQ